MSYTYAGEHRQILFLQRHVERLTYLLGEKLGFDVADELMYLEAEVERLELVVEAKDAEIARAVAGSGLAQAESKVRGLEIKVRSLDDENRGLRENLRRVTDDLGVAQAEANRLRVTRPARPVIAAPVAVVVDEAPRYPFGRWNKLELE